MIEEKLFFAFFFKIQKEIQLENEKLRKEERKTWLNEQQNCHFLLLFLFC